jgi:VanZ family protein
MAPTGRARGWAAIVLVVYSAVAAVILLVPRPIDRGVTPWIRGVLDAMHRLGMPGSVDYELVELASHVVLFVPFGILTVVVLGRRLAWLAVLVGVGAGALVEVGPSFSSEHVASTLDLVLNIAGAIAGVAIGTAILLGLRDDRLAPERSLDAPEA